MGGDAIRHLLAKRLANGETAYFWNPSKTLRNLGLTAEALGRDEPKAKRRALELNNLADEVRRTAKGTSNGPLPGSVSRLFSDYMQSEEFGELRERTRKDYRYYLEKIEAEFGHLPVSSLTPLVIKAYYRRIRNERSVTWAYHVLSTLRAVLSWAVSEDWIPKNPALDVSVKSPPKRTVRWEPEQAKAYIAKAYELGWASIAVMALVFDSTAQSPIDVRLLKKSNYDGYAISNVRIKTGVTGAPIPLFPEAKAALDDYLGTRPSLLPEAPLFVNDRIGGEWVYSTLCKRHNEIRAAAGLPKRLQLQDFRRTAQTEAGAAGGTVDEIRGLARHSTRSAAEHYVHPDGRFIEAVQSKRLASRNKSGSKVRMSGKPLSE
jgi:site-specific recombinase XerD